uniref:Plant-specific domain TIGR01615 family protein n=1 Tax=Kalanchoe fedtschenkoi TaxID=63787 RepID=A0A7N1A210_KALFE
MRGPGYFHDPTPHKLIYYTSSGSEHDGAADMDEDSPSLSDLVDCFLEESYSYQDDDDNAETDRSAASDNSESVERVINSVIIDSSDDHELRQLVAPAKGDQYRSLLTSQVQLALEMFQFRGAENVSRQQQVVLRGVMSHLRSLAHDAAVCKTKWNASASGSLVSGSYEFIDVVVDSSSTSSTSTPQLRYLVDLHFASKFEIARPTEAYARLLNLLPGAAFVGTEEELRRVVKLMSDAAKRSLKSRELHLPPWRKNRYMHMKWFGPYRRTINSVPAAGGGRWRAERTAVGFDLQVYDGGVNGGQHHMTASTFN